MQALLSAVLVAGLSVFGARSAAAATGSDPDWPCVQRKVLEISAGQVWNGPPLDGIGESWRDDEALADLARSIASRRTDMAAAKEKIAAFASAAGPDKDRRLTLLFAGVLATINAERSSIIAGIGRYARRQQGLAEKISAQAEELDRLPKDDATDEQIDRREELLEIQAWDSRIFRERERSLQYVCELPVLLDQRAFALGREISAQLDK
jgi:hypothetical protein